MYLFYKYSYSYKVEKATVVTRLTLTRNIWSKAGVDMYPSEWRISALYAFSYQTRVIFVLILLL